MIKVCTSSVNPASKLFYCSICVMYNRANCALNFLLLKSYISCNDSLVYPKIHYANLFSGKLVNELHNCIEKHPDLIQSPNVSDSLFVKINGTHVNKWKHLIQVSVLELHNDLMLPIYQGGLFGLRTADRKVYI